MRAERMLVWALAAIAVAAALSIAGVHPPTQLALSAAALAVAGALLALRRMRPMTLVPFLLPAACGLVATVVQLVPFPAGLVSLVSPNAVALREAAGQTGWVPMTLDVAGTAFAALRAATCLGLLASTVMLVRSAGRAHRLLAVLALAGGAMAVLHFAQRASGAQAILWMYKPRAMPGSGFFGTFVAGNNAAAFFSLTALVATGLALQLEGWRKAVMAACAGLAVVAMLSTLSRGGAVGFVVGAGTLTVFLLRQRVGTARALIFTVGVAGLVAGAALWLVDDLRARFVAHSTAQITDSQKVRGWRDGLVLASHYPLTGVGRGAFESPIHAYRQDSEGVRLVYPENLVVQLASEWGFPVTAGLAILLALSTSRLVRKLGRADVTIVAAACGVLAVVVHELADFSLELPGVAFPTAIVLGVVIARGVGKHEPDKVRHRVGAPWLAGALATWVVLLGVAAWALPHTQDADWRRLSQPNAGADEIAAAIRRHPAEPHFELLAARERLKAKQPADALRALNRALLLQPSNVQAHHLAARTLASMRRTGQAALEYRMAAEHGLPIAWDELIVMTGSHAIDAVPQHPGALVDLAANLEARNKLDLAEAACGRAAELAQSDLQLVLERCAQIAVSSGNVPGISRAADALMAASPSASGYVTAARTFEAAGAPDRADQAVSRGLAAHPGDPALVLYGAESAFARNDFARARQLLRTVAGNAAFSLADRIKAEELAARVAEREGDLEGAVGARARAKILARRMHELEPTP